MCARADESSAESLKTSFLLFDVMELSYREISNILAISVETKVCLHRARKLLKSILGEKCRLYIDERNILACGLRVKE